MNKRNALYLLGLFLLVFSSCTSKISGPLKVSSANPRYFENAQKQVIYLTGSHTWNNFKDFSYQHDRPPFDFPTYLKFLKNHDHNFIRLWTWDLLNWETEGMEHPDYNAFRIGPFAWERTGPGLAADGLPKFDLLRFEEAYFDRLERRVRQARRQGIFVSVMLFEGYGTQFT
ncbi:MAG: hypothetical protein KDD15_08375, partial [Lewinella sp.]|nr:hypothetical protein [Lewinella sp.]